MSEEKATYLSKTVTINGEAVTLYSSNGMTWLSRPDDIPSTMERLENHRITLNDPKDENGQPVKKAAPKERFKPKGPRGAPQTVQSDRKADGAEDLEEIDEIDDLDDELDDLPLDDSSDDETEPVQKQAADDTQGRSKVIELPNAKVANISSVKADPKAKPSKAVKAEYVSKPTVEPRPAKKVEKAPAPAKASVKKAKPAPKAAAKTPAKKSVKKGKAPAPKKKR